MTNYNERLDEQLNYLMEYSYKYGRDEIPSSEDPPLIVARQAKQAIQSLIRTEKLKLLAEVRERVMNEGELVDAEILKKLYDKAYSNGYNDRGYENSYNSRDYRSAEDIAPIIAKIRGGYDKRFAALTRLEAEL